MNTRNLSGYPISLERSTSYNRFWRSDLPLFLSQQEIDFFKEKNVTSVVDLRSDDEIKRSPSFCYNQSYFFYFHCPLYRNDSVPLVEKDITLSYMNMLFDSTIILKIMKFFATSSGVVLYYCTAGKDRKGVISALLLSLVGISL